MKLFAISDLHLAFTIDKPMHVFGDNWNEHYRKIKRDWYEKVSPEDLVVIGGDISWAMRFEDAMVDLEWIDALPGQKVLIKGNHDYWWQSIHKMTTGYPGLFFLQNNYMRYHDIAIVGTRGWLLPGSEDYTQQDDKIYKRELLRLERSLQLAQADPLVKEMLAVFHYPPVTKDQPQTLYSDLLRKYGVRRCVYGHLHDEESWKNALQGESDGIDYRLTSCDYTDFHLVELSL